MQLRCACGNILGEYVAECFIIRHRGREWIGKQLLAVRCEDCGLTWEPPELVMTSGKITKSATECNRFPMDEAARKGRAVSR